MRVGRGVGAVDGHRRDESHPLMTAMGRSLNARSLMPAISHASTTCGRHQCDWGGGRGGGAQEIDANAVPLPLPWSHPTPHPRPRTTSTSGAALNPKEERWDGV